MKNALVNTSRIGTFGLLLVVVFVGICAAQSNPVANGLAVQRVWGSDWNLATPGPFLRIGGESVPRDKFVFFWETRIFPATPALANELSTQAYTTSGSPVIHRITIDRTGQTYFGYDVLVDELPELNTFRLTFQPLKLDQVLAKSLGLRMDPWSSWNPLPAPRFPDPQVVRGGEVLELTLLTNPATKQNIIDYVSIQPPLPQSSSLEWSTAMLRAYNDSYATGNPRDITSTDVEMTIQSPKISVNGKLEEATQSHSEKVSGVFIWFYIPNRGRFILSMAPHAGLGFQKSGDIRGSALVFTDGSDRYTVNTEARIAPGQAAFNLYVLRQSNWKPTYLFADTSAFAIGGVDRFEDLEK